MLFNVDSDETIFPDLIEVKVYCNSSLKFKTRLDKHNTGIWEEEGGEGKKKERKEEEEEDEEEEEERGENAKEGQLLSAGRELLKSSLHEIAFSRPNRDSLADEKQILKINSILISFYFILFTANKQPTKQANKQRQQERRQRDRQAGRERRISFSRTCF